MSTMTMTSGGVASSYNRADPYLITAWQVDKIVTTLGTNVGPSCLMRFLCDFFFCSFGNAIFNLDLIPNFVHKSTYFLVIMPINWKTIFHQISSCRFQPKASHALVSLFTSICWHTANKQTKNITVKYQISL